MTGRKELMAILIGACNTCIIICIECVTRGFTRHIKYQGFSNQAIFIIIAIFNSVYNRS